MSHNCNFFIPFKHNMCFYRRYRYRKLKQRSLSSIQFSFTPEKWIVWFQVFYIPSLFKGRLFSQLLLQGTHLYIRSNFLHLTVWGEEKEGRKEEGKKQGIKERTLFAFLRNNVPFFLGGYAALFSVSCLSQWTLNSVLIHRLKTWMEQVFK